MKKCGLLLLIFVSSALVSMGAPKKLNVKRVKPSTVRMQEFNKVQDECAALIKQAFEQKDYSVIAALEGRLKDYQAAYEKLENLSQADSQRFLGAIDTVQAVVTKWHEVKHNIPAR